MTTLNYEIQEKFSNINQAFQHLQANLEATYNISEEVIV